MQTLEINKTYSIGDKRFVLNEDLKLTEIAKSIYDLKKGERYYFINEAGEIVPTTFEDDEYNKNTIEIGNAFLTKDEAEFELERRKIVAKIKRWKYENDGDYKFTARGYNYCIRYDCDDKELYVDWRFTSKDDSNYLYFNREETATECLKFIGEKNWKKYILEIE